MSCDRDNFICKHRLWLGVKRRQLHSYLLCSWGTHPALRNCRSSSSSVTWPPSLRSVMFSKNQLFSTASHEGGPPDVPGHLRQVSTARVCKQRGLHLSTVIFYQYIPSFFTALLLCLCTWTCIFRNLVCARSAKPSDCEDVCTDFCRVTCSELNEDNIVCATPVEIKRTSRNAMSQSQCLETRDKQKAKWLLVK